MLYLHLRSFHLCHLFELNDFNSLFIFAHKKVVLVSKLRIRDESKTSRKKKKRKIKEGDLIRSSNMI